MQMNPERKETMFKFGSVTVYADGTSSASVSVPTIAGYKAIGLTGFAAGGSYDAVLKMHALTLNVGTQTVRVAWSTNMSSPNQVEASLIYCREDLL